MRSNEASLLAFEIGAGYGDNIPYYLELYDRLVVVDADREKVDQISIAYRTYIESGRLICLNNAVALESDVELDFWLDLNNPLVSKVLPHGGKPPSSEGKLVSIQSISLHDLIEQCGVPNFLKIDIEGGEVEIVRSVLSKGIRIPEIQMECSTKKWIRRPWFPDYKSFAMVLGCDISTLKLREKRMFSLHSAGPVSCDLTGYFLPIKLLALVNFFGREAWKDIHLQTCAGQISMAGLLYYLKITLRHFVWNKRIRIRLKRFLFRL